MDEEQARREWNGEPNVLRGVIQSMSEAKKRAVDSANETIKKLMDRVDELEKRIAE